MVFPLPLFPQTTQSPANPQETRILQQQIKITDRQIDQPAYQLHALTDEQIKIVEFATT